MEQTSPEYPPLPSGNDPALLATLPRWNWGAFWLTWVWAAGHDMLLLSFLALLTMGLFPLPNIICGYFGNELAWKHRPFSGREEFHAVELAWEKWANVLLLGFVLSMLVMLAMTLLRQPQGG